MAAPVETKSDVRCRVWMGTWNNPPPEYLEWMSSLWDNGMVKFVAGQLEIGEKEHTPHLQFVVYFPNPVRLSTVRNLRPGGGIHYEPCGDRFKQSYAYVTKSDTRSLGPWEYGDKPNPGRRSDLHAMAVMIRDGEVTSMRELDMIAPHMSVQYGRGFADLIERNSAPRSWYTQCVYLWGRTGIGKSYGIPRSAYFPVFEPISRTFSWFGYSRHEIVVFDDADASAVRMEHWLNYANDRELRLQVKGRDPVNFVAKKCVFISNDPPSPALLEQERWTRRWRVVEVQTREEASEFWSQFLVPQG